MMLLCSILLILALVGHTLEDDITLTSREEYYLESSRVKISCNYTVKSDILLWYRQYSGSAPQFRLYTTVTSKPSVIRAKSDDTRLSVHLSKERTCVDLEISSAEVTDSALYYCALSLSSILYYRL
uniref:Immunoglobulin V-set domain-containing protein n=1 Tax=Hucho hucho TaxID=62062 RepID=A0A4W5L9V4_9TELE